MKKSKVRKTSPTGKKLQQTVKPPADSLPNDEIGKPFDFGGLPERDLKKNLGCG